MKTDEELMSAYQAGDMDSFRELYEAHKGRVMGYLHSRLNDQDEAEDVFQQVFLKLHRYRHRYRSEVPFLPWLFTITRNAMIDHIRRGKMDRCRAGDSEAILESLAAPAEEGADPGEILAQMTSLSEKQRQVLEMRFQQGWDFEEIAGYFQTSAVNARKMVSRAMAAIRKMKPS